MARTELKIGKGYDGIGDLDAEVLEKLNAMTTEIYADIAKRISASAALDFPSVAAGASADLTIALVGAALGDIVALGVPNAAVIANTIFMAWVSAADVVTVRIVNNSAGAVDPVSGNFKVLVHK